MADGTGLYHPSQFGLDREALRTLHRIEPKRSLIAALAVWVEIACLVVAAGYLIPAPYFWWAYVPLIFFIAGRQGALLQLVHEGSHDLLAKSKQVNDRIGKWLCALPIGVNYKGYSSGHILHHAYTGTDRDPPSDSEKYRIVDLRNPMLYVLFLKDLAGLSALSVFRSYVGNAASEGRRPRAEAAPLWKRFRGLGELGLVQLIVLVALFQFRIGDYLLLWIVPAASIHMFLMRIRGIAEHGLAKQRHVTVTRPEEGNFYTRSFGTPKKRYAFAPFVWLEQALIGSINVYYHHEHHLYPRVPFYNLPKLHKLVAEKASAYNPEIYVPGYFAAFARGVKV